MSNVDLGFDTRFLLHEAFDQLREDGYFAEPGGDCGAPYWTCCMTCGQDELPDGTENYVFYHMQDADHLREFGNCYLAYGGDADHIVRRLKEAGLVVEWNGSRDTRIKVTAPPQH
jgi:hypothetical protein